MPSPGTGRRTLTAAALQARQLTFVSPAARARAREPLIAQAAARGAELAVLADRPGWDEITDDAIAAASELAHQYRICLVADLGHERDGEMRAYRAGSVFAPDGSRLGSQRQTHLSDEDRALLFTPGDRLRVFHTGVARLGLLLGADVLFPETGRALMAQGTDLLVHIGELREAEQDAWCARLVRQVQEHGVPGVEAYTVGQGLIGRSAVLAPVSLARVDVLAQVEDPTLEAAVAAPVPLGR